LTKVLQTLFERMLFKVDFCKKSLLISD